MPMLWFRYFIFLTTFAAQVLEDQNYCLNSRSKLVTNNRYRQIIRMQSKKNVNNPETPVFNIRKVNRKITLPIKNYAEFKQFSESHQPEQEIKNFSCIYKFTDARQEKEMILDQTVNEAIVNSKVYSDLKTVYLEGKKKHGEEKKAMEGKLEKKKQQKQEATQQKERLEKEIQKYLDAVNKLKQKIHLVQESNESYRQSLNNQMSGQAEYISNLLISMRFQAQYDHNIDPDQMTYEELLQLQEKIGIVSKGLTPEVISSLPKIQVLAESEQQCTICFESYQKGEYIVKLSPCKHEFHFECLGNWLSKQKICPNCKQQIDIPVQ